MRGVVFGASTNVVAEEWLVYTESAGNSSHPRANRNPPIRVCQHMQRSAAIALVCVCSIFALSFVGCGSSESTTPAGASAPAASGNSWWGGVLVNVNRATGQALEVIHDGTGWVLGKNKVEIEQVGEVKEVEGKRLAEFKITVSRSDESFAANIENIECDELGLPTDQSQEKMNEAVEKIKTMLDKLQS